jgi:hypothetical protein
MADQAGSGIAHKVHTEEINEYPDDFKEEYLRICNWAEGIAQRFGPQVRVMVIDPFSWGGIVRIFRHWIRHYPTVILEGRERFVGWESAADMTARLNQLLIERNQPVPTETGA